MNRPHSEDFHAHFRSVLALVAALLQALSTARLLGAPERQRPTAPTVPNKTGGFELTVN